MENVFSFNKPVVKCMEYKFPFSLRVERNGGKWVKEDMDMLCKRDLLEIKFTEQ